MEKVIDGFGFGITCFFFLCMLVIGSQFIWGAVAGVGITALGLLFWEE